MTVSQATSGRPAASRAQLAPAVCSSPSAGPRTAARTAAPERFRRSWPRQPAPCVKRTPTRSPSARPATQLARYKPCPCAFPHTEPYAVGIRTMAKRPLTLRLGTLQACPGNSSAPAKSTAITACMCNAGYEAPDGEYCPGCRVGTYKVALLHFYTGSCCSQTA